MTMHYIQLEDSRTYTGADLRPRFIYETTGVVGNAILSFIGPCRVEAAHMVDLEDVRAQAWIYSRSMLHFLVECFDVSLLAAVGLQRLLIDHLGQTLAARGVTGIARRGDDLYDGMYKLSVSIAAPATTSCLIHVGINIESADTPVPTRGLSDYTIAPLAFAQDVAHAFIDEFVSMQRACYKVKEL